jgi:3-methyladenine DNA glycosylase AlkD
MINNIVNELKALSKPDKIEIFQKYFDTKIGDTDEFIGVTVPNIRKIARKYSSISLSETEALLKSNYHEARLTALIILTLKYPKSEENEQKEIFDLYLKNTKYINNWDLVDSSAHKIVGMYLQNKPKDLLFELAKSKYLWDRRISIISTFAYIKQGEIDTTLQLAKLLLPDKNHYIHKAVGWALREVGKKDIIILKEFLQNNYSDLPRTSLRYAIERFSSNDKEKFLKARF